MVLYLCFQFSKITCCLLIKIVCYQNIVAHQKMYHNYYHVYFWQHLRRKLLGSKIL